MNAHDEIRRLWFSLFDDIRLATEGFYRDVLGLSYVLDDTYGIVACDFREHRRYMTMPEHKALIVRPCSSLIVYKEMK